MGLDGEKVFSPLSYCSVPSISYNQLGKSRCAALCGENEMAFSPLRSTPHIGSLALASRDRAAVDSGRRGPSVREEQPKMPTRRGFRYQRMELPLARSKRVSPARTAVSVTTRAMRLNTEMAPDPADPGLADAQLFGQSIAAPVGGPFGRTSTSGLQDTGLPFGGTRPRLTPPDNANPVRPNALLESASSTPEYTRRYNPDAPKPGKNDLRPTSK